ncbi:PSD1 and planctomycete cytochrome C domain-containing protein [Rhodopirellula sp. SWK7]|uniref:PSD1 and planctomycete cytochrome C domain-containing protein n=1 Tax=Rhodopirellula sp. SWK7 TaxID=595460 RepID=UPI0002BF511E|nr:PSD1 and planctomycete cytochrome C domain-containing protein [Rhodopirellula sp. SWK7]EMI41562.1 planctomycete cytochrome C domain protein [Rhodopirellula sp. SWK7]
MNIPERRDLLLQKHHAGQLDSQETAELRELLKSEPEALDRYLDLCQLDEQLASLSEVEPLAQAKPLAQAEAVQPIVTPASSAPDHRFTQTVLAVSVAAVALLIVGVVAWRDRQSSDNGALAMNDVISRDGHVKAESAESPKRSPNPWKVINSTGSMNHPSLTEASVPNVVSAAARKIQFNRDIRPILSETCFHCHGPDEEGRRAGLRLDTADGAEEDLGGYQAIAPGDLDESEAWTRITSDDPDLLMPPPESHMVLSEEQKTLLKRWIEQGAEYEGHWAFMEPESPEIPEVNFAETKGEAKWVRGAIDSFVAARLAEANMSPSAEADPRTLIRRLTFDLTGLPPTVEETRGFVDDYEARGEAAYQDVVERLLSSHHFGERMAVPWLDQARYADTNGYSIDGGRDVWLWRDWVIQAYNDNMPFDQFVTEQLAGDLLPDATDAQRIATGFNRNHMITHEGGTIPAENLTNYAADRVKTTGEVFLGLTMGCAQCHDHKYDPISQKEYYQFFAFFNELEDRGLDGNAGVNSAPRMMTSTVLRSNELDDIDAELAAVRQELSATTDGFSEWLAAERKREIGRGDGFHYWDAELLDASSPNRPGPFEFKPDGTVIASIPSKGLNGFSHSIRLPTGDQEPSETVSGVRIEFYPQQVADDKEGDDKDSDEKDADDKDNVADDKNDEKALSLTPFADGVPKITTVLVSANSQPADQVDYYGQCAFTMATASSTADQHAATSVLDERNLQWWQPAAPDSKQHLTLTFDQPVDPTQTPYLSVLVFFGTGQSLPYRWRVRAFSGKDTDSKWDEAVASAIVKDQEQWDNDTRQRVLTVFRETAPGLNRLRTRLANLEERRSVLTANHSTMVMNTAAKPRETFVLSRGQYDAPTVRVTPQTPQALPALLAPAVKQSGGGDEETEQSGGNATRLDLARWLTDPKHPLTSRVAVNRVWAMLFGTGIVATSADFGSQGEYPSHPELLDYLATQFVDSGWNQKELIRKIVSSATYRQQSIATAEQRELDPKNRLLARGPRFRLPAEFIRDQALAVSGLLVPRIGGPSVHPYQPHGLWKEVSHFGSTPATKQVFVQDHGEKLYRRSLYTIVKRTSPHPAMAAFDAPNREMCTVDRGATNTPLQALVTLNDPQFAEAARVLAESLLRDESVTDDHSRIGLAFERIVSRPPSDAELKAVAKLLESERARYRDTPDDAIRAVSIGESPQAKEIDAVEHAAWTQVATLLLNLSEALTRT